ncbi:hypothetical protein ACJX0J_031123, partial [Zea mays]
GAMTRSYLALVIKKEENILLLLQPARLDPFIETELLFLLDDEPIAIGNDFFSSTFFNWMLKMSTFFNKQMMMNKISFRIAI